MFALRELASDRVPRVSPLDPLLAAAYEYSGRGRGSASRRCGMAAEPPPSLSYRTTGSTCLHRSASSWASRSTRGSSSPPSGLREPKSTLGLSWDPWSSKLAPGSEQGREKVGPSGEKVRALEQCRVSQDLKHSPGAIPPAHESLLTPTGLGRRNRVTVTTEERSQTSYQRCPGRVQKGGPATLTCVHRRLQACSFNWEFLDHRVQRPEVCSKPGGPETKNLEMPWRLEYCDPARCTFPCAAGSLPAPGDRCSLSLRRPLCQGGCCALVRNHYRNEFALLFTKKSCHQKRNKITTYRTLS